MSLAESVRQRLLNRAKAINETFDLVLTHYGLERLLYRISQSKWKKRIFLKGALLFSVWHDSPHRFTRDLQNGGQVFYAYTISVNVDEEIGYEVKGFRLPG